MEYSWENNGIMELIWLNNKIFMTYSWDNNGIFMNITYGVIKHCWLGSRTKWELKWENHP